jgi:hypothetical protein
MQPADQTLHPLRHRRWWTAKVKATDATHRRAKYQDRLQGVTMQGSIKALRALIPPVALACALASCGGEAVFAVHRQ